MSAAQIELLKRCISAMRDAEEKDHELVEVGRISGVSAKTAKSLVDCGLLVEDMPSWANEMTNTHVRLPKKEEIIWKK